MKLRRKWPSSSAAAGSAGGTANKSSNATTSKLVTRRSGADRKMTMSMLSMVPSTSKNVPTPSTSLYTAAYNTRRRSSTASTSTDQQPHQSPDSPGIGGRVAKSNARLLNGLDLSTIKQKSGVYLDAMIALPEFKTFELNDKCPMIDKLIKSEDKTLNIEQLSAIQFELEELIAQNVDYQKTIQGEITYVTTGEYPTVDLKNRPMPVYEKLSAAECKKLSERAKTADPTPNTSLVADLRTLSSPEDEEEQPHILDVPNRFWTWSKEYLRHISMDYIKEFKEKLIDQYSEESMRKYFEQGIKSDQHSPKSKMLGTGKRGQQKRKLDDSKESQKTPIKQLKLQRSPNSTASSSKQSESPKNKNMPKGDHQLKADKISPQQMNGKHPTSPQLINGLHPRLLSNGIHDDGKRGTRKSTGKEGAKKKAHQIKAINEGSDEDDDQMEDGEVEEEEDVELEKKPGTSQIQEEEEEEEDEVTRELGRKQAQLRELLGQTRPIIKELYMRALKEHAVHEVFAKLDVADNKLYALGSKVERLNVFNKEQRQAVKATVREHRASYAAFHEKTPKCEAQ